MRGVTFKKTCIAVWVVIWLFYLGRGLIRGEWVKTERIFQQPSGHQMAALMDDPEFYWFVDRCRRELPAGATYQLMTSFEAWHLDVRRAHYLLYPALLTWKKPDYLLLYQARAESPRDYRLVGRFRESGVILKRKDR